MNPRTAQGRRHKNGSEVEYASVPAQGQGRPIPVDFFQASPPLAGWSTNGASLPDWAAAMAMSSPALWNPMAATGSIPPDPSMHNSPIAAGLAASVIPNLHSPSPFPTAATTGTITKANAPIPPNTPRPSRRKTVEVRDDIVEPSPESGGRAEPTAAYTLRASFAPIRLPSPRPILVVIDLNGTLLYRPSRKNPSRFVERPHARRFLAYCVDTFWVVIWSSARDDNVRRMCAQLLSPEQLARVVAVWGRHRFGLTRADYAKRVWCYKRLTRLWDDPVVAASHPEHAAGGRWGQGNTALVDDSVEKARSEPHNLVRIPEFAGDPDDDTSVLPRVHDYLNELCSQSDVSTYIRAHPFHEGQESDVNHG
ncbi:HAD-like protein [Pleurostoma richardsiae]|uniref:Mitochondrial import inner membrane translocase subunit TIM50 n=1 Tax=Pleurostoma richardsiae TaxID=41990 RepID=A0AA38VH83_9PEZI|nr:HAD-like protein [Pleurostoma richardsiae]